MNNEYSALPELDTSGLCTVLRCTCLPLKWLHAIKVNLFIFLQHNWTVNFTFSCIIIHCPICISKTSLFVFTFFAYWIGTIVCIIPKSSEKYVVEMFPMLNNSHLWMLVIEQLFIYGNKQTASSFTCNFYVYWKAWVYGNCI